MKNLDFNKEEIKEKAIKAIEEGNIEEQAEILEAWVEGVAQDVAKEVSKEQRTLENDTMILTSRGAKQLTSEELKYYEKLSEAMKSSNPKQALTDLDIVMPTTTINRIFDDIEEAHPLLKRIKINNVTGLTEVITRTGDVETAWWGTLCDEIKKELEAGFKKESTTLYKLSAFLPICKAYLTLGPAWLDKFIRTIITESMTSGLVKAIVTGTGVESPIGMDCDLEKEFKPGEARPKKEAIKIKDFEPITLGKIIAILTNKGKRIVTKVALIVNPVDYWEKVFAITTTKNALGQYVANQFPFPVDIIQETGVNIGKAIIGLPEKYDLNVGMNQKMEYDDSIRFLDDERVYLGKMYANGKPVDNNSFLLLDISEVSPDSPSNNPVKVEVPSKETELLGKTAEELQENVVIADNKVTGTLKYIDSYPGFSKNAKGNFLALYFDEAKNGKDVMCELKGTGATDKKPKAVDKSDGLAVFNVHDKDNTIEVTCEGQESRTLTLEGLELKQAQ